MFECAVCDGRFTVDRLIELRLGPPVTVAPVPLCLIHYCQCEAALLDWQKTRTPPCILNIRAVGTGSDPGRLS
jgi:hypothetical protein